MDKAIAFANKEIDSVMSLLGKLSSEAQKLHIKATIVQAYLQGWYDCEAEKATIGANNKNRGFGNTPREL